MVARVTAHVRRIWPGREGLLPLALLAWPLLRFATGGGRIEHVAFVVALVVLAVLNERTKRALVGLTPFALLGIVYDAMRYVKDVGLTTSRIHACDLRDLDARLFGVGGEPLPDYFQAHSSALLDRLCAIPYGTFLHASVAVGIWLYWRDYGDLRRFGWTLLMVSLAGFFTYHVIPAAPPWYVQAHGCTPLLDAHASEGPNLARVDAWMGTDYFASFYGRSSDVFGAIPSLHVAYPLLILIFTWRHLRWVGRSAAVVFFAGMCFAAVYLDHHWVVDVVLGVLYTLIGTSLLGWLWRGPVLGSARLEAAT